MTKYVSTSHNSAIQVCSSLKIHVWLILRPCRDIKQELARFTSVVTGSETCILDSFGLVSSTPIWVTHTQLIDRLLIRVIFDDYHARTPSVTGEGDVCWGIPPAPDSNWDRGRICWKVRFRLGRRSRKTNLCIPDSDFISRTCGFLPIVGW